LKSTVLLKRNIKISVDFKSRCSYNGGMNRKGPYNVSPDSQSGTDSRRVLEGAGIALAAGLIGAAGVFILMASTAPDTVVNATSVQSKDGSVVGTSVLVNESICNQKTPVASITVDGETIELFITPSQQ
jgi:hypothetical protein